MRVLVGAIIAFPTIWSGGPTPGSELLGLRYRDEASAPSAGVLRTGVEGAPLRRSQRLIHGARVSARSHSSTLLCKSRLRISPNCHPAPVPEQLPVPIFNLLFPSGIGLLLGRYLWLKLDQHARICRWAVRSLPIATGEHRTSFHPFPACPPSLPVPPLLHKRVRPSHPPPALRTAPL